jgi:hypothetical protein
MSVLVYLDEHNVGAETYSMCDEQLTFCLRAGLLESDLQRRQWSCLKAEIDIFVDRWHSTARQTLTLARSRYYFAYTSRVKRW